MPTSNNLYKDNSINLKFLKRRSSMSFRKMISIVAVVATLMGTVPNNTQEARWDSPQVTTQLAPKSGFGLRRNPLAEGFKQIALPKNFAPALQPYGFKPEKVEVLRLKSEGAVDGILSDPLTSLATSSSLSQAVGSILFAGRGKEVKEVADGNAVHFTERSIEYFAETHGGIAIVILADEGGRDDSFALPIGRVYYSEEADGGRNLRKIDFQGVTTLKGNLEALRAKGFKILYFVGDALEKTNGLIVPEAAKQPTDSTSLFSLFIEDEGSRLDGKNRFLIHDKHWRVGGVSFNAPDDAGVDTFDLPSVALSKIAGSNARAKGLKEGTPAFDAYVREYIDNTTILALGPREADLEKDAAKAVSEHRHQSIMNDAKALQGSYPGLKLQFPGDGDCLPRIVASLGLDLDGRHLVVFGRSGSAEGMASTIPVADQGDAQFVHAIVAKKATDGGKDGKFERENAHNYTGEELGTYADLGIVGDGFNQVTKPARSRADIKGKGILATTSVTGASPGQFGETFANNFQRVRVEQTTGKEGVAVTNTLLVTPQGAFIVRTTFSLSDFEETRRDILQASHAARQYYRTEGLGAIEELLRNIEGTIRVTPTGVEILDEKKLRTDAIHYLAREASLNKSKNAREVAQRIIREAGIALGIKEASIHDFYLARNEGKWSNLTVPAYNIRAGVYKAMRMVIRAVMKDKAGAFIFELAKSEKRYTAQDLAEYVAMGYAAAIAEGYRGLLFFQGDHYQVDAKTYRAGATDTEKAANKKKALGDIEKLIKEAVAAGKRNIDVDPSTLVNEEALDKVLAFERAMTTRYITERSKQDPDFAREIERLGGLKENADEESEGIWSLRRKLVDDLEVVAASTLSTYRGDLSEYLGRWGITSSYYRNSFVVFGPTTEEISTLQSLYRQMHQDTFEVTMHFMRFIRNLEKELGITTPISIGVEERHIDSKKHKKYPSTVLGSITLMGQIIARCNEEGLVVPSKLALQTGTMHGLGGIVDWGIFQRHQLAREAIGVSVFVQHGTSTLNPDDFNHMPPAGTGEAHLATEYQKITLGVIARMMPELRDQMAAFLEALLYPEKATADIKKRMKETGTIPEKDLAGYPTKFKEAWEKALAQPGKTRDQILVEILSDSLEGELKGSLKDLVKELPGPFKAEINNLPADVQAEVGRVLLAEFRRINAAQNVAGTRAQFDQLLSFDAQSVVLPPRPKLLQEAVRETARMASAQDGESSQRTWISGQYTPAQAIDAGANTQAYLVQAGRDRRIFAVLGHGAQGIKTGITLYEDKMVDRPAGSRRFLIPSEREVLIGRLKDAAGYHKAAIEAISLDNLVEATGGHLSDWDLLRRMGYPDLGTPSDKEAWLRRILLTRVRHAIVYDEDDKPFFSIDESTGQPVTVTASSGNYLYAGYKGSDMYKEGSRPKTIYMPLASVEGYAALQDQGAAMRAYISKLLHELFEVESDSKTHRTEGRDVSALINTLDRRVLAEWNVKKRNQARAEVSVMQADGVAGREITELNANLAEVTGGRLGNPAARAAAASP